MKIEKQNNKFRVITQEFRTQWYPDNRSNRKIVLIMLRGLQKENGEALFTFKELATIVESQNQQAASQHIEDFREYGEDFFETIRRKQRQVYQDLRDPVVKVLKQNPLLGEKAIAEKVSSDLGRQVKRGVVRLTLENISCIEIRYALKKQIEKGQAHYKEKYLIESLLKKLDSQKVQQKKEKIFENARILASQTAKDTVPKSKETKDIQRLFETQNSIENISTIWQSPLGWKLLVFVLYFHGLSQSVIAGWFGVNKSTICRWLKRISSIGERWTKAQDLAFSFKIAVDEKWVKVSGQWWYLFAAVDVITGCPIHINLYPSNSGDYCKLFLIELKSKGYTPKIIITDGWDGYIKAIKTIFPKAEHLLCRFHLLQSVFRRLRKAKIFSYEIACAVGKLFQTSYKRTVRRRITNLENQLMPLDAVNSVLSGFHKKLPQVIKAVGSVRRPSTSNAVEGFFSKFDRFYRLKGPFCDEASAKKHIHLFMLGYLFAIGSAGQACPLEKANTNVTELPFYHLFNRPNLLLLKEKITQQYQVAA